MKWAISTAIDSTIANSFLSRMHKSMGNLIIIIEKERLIREGSSQEKHPVVSAKQIFSNLLRWESPICIWYLEVSSLHGFALF